MSKEQKEPQKEKSVDLTSVVNMQTPNTILKLVYKIEFFDISVMKIGARLVATINADGTVVFKEYKSGSRKVESAYRGKCTVEAFRLLCYRIEECLSTADRLEAKKQTSAELCTISSRRML